MKKFLLTLSLSLALAALFCGPAFAVSPPGEAPAASLAYKGPGIKLTWKAPADVPATKVRGYNIYRSSQILGHYEKVNATLLTDLSYEDRGLVKGKNYYYRVTTVFTDGTESKPTTPVGMTVGEAAVYKLPEISFFTTDALGKIKYLGEEAVFILKGDAGLKAVFDIEGVATGLPMKELEPGTYKGVYKVTAGQRVENASATAVLTDARGGRATARATGGISLLGVKKPSLAGLYAGILESDRVGLNWPRLDGSNGYYQVYRDTNRIVGMEGHAPVSGKLSAATSSYIDNDVRPGVTYYYVLVMTDLEGSVVSFTDNLEVRVPDAGRVSGMEVAEDSDGRELKPGGVLTVTVKAGAGGKAYFSLADAVKADEMKEDARGSYRGVYTVKEGDGVFKSRVSVSFRDSSGVTHFTNSATFVSVNAPKVQAGAAKVSGKKPVIRGIRDDIPAVAGISGKLAAGKTFTVTMEGDPGNKAYFSVGDGIWKVPMQEEPGTPGLYKGAYTVKPGDSAGTSPDALNRVFLEGYLEGPGGAVSDPARGPAPVVIDTSCNIKVEPSATSLPADTRSRTKVAFTVTDADGEPVKNRRLTVLVEPPPHYTGMVGGGGVGVFQPGTSADQTGQYGKLQLDFDDLTDDFGRVTATYTSGFAAKTAMIVARDFSTGSTGMSYVTTSISSSVNVTLEKALPGAGAVVAPPPVYQLQLEVVPDPANPVRTYPGFLVEAVPNVLTADGISRANIIATLTRDGVPVAAKTIVFAVTGAGGRLTKSSASTDISGRAQVFYVAGTRAGKALVTATETTTGASAVSIITLLADAPARIYAKAYPDTLPADGMSTSRVVVELADINNNPTDGIGVNFALRGGASGGGISLGSGVTDLRGAIDFVYTAGNVPGVATIDIEAKSPPPGSDELAAALARVIAPVVYDNNDFTELVVLKWFKAIGDPVGRGEPLALVSTPLGDMKVYSPAQGILDQITVGPGFNVMEGKEIGKIR
jgi:hypothetical protein